MTVALEANPASDSCRVALVGGDVAYVDRDDLPLVEEYPWYRHKARHTTYARRFWRVGGRQYSQYMHVLIAGARGVDHVDHDGLNNRRSNLRVATSQQNAANTRVRRGTSRYKGVYWDSSNRKWRAQIKHDGKAQPLGRFTSEEEAARAYDDAARSIFGEFAQCNL